MEFISNPFNFGDTPEEAKKNQISIDLLCKTFDFIDIDADEENQKPLVGVHLWIDHDNYVINGLDQVENEEIKEKFFINRTIFNT
jgi:hypothetical protein